jgi:hypothetical protein
VGRASAVADFDNDGDLDIVISNLGTRPYLFRNDSTPRRHWLSVAIDRPGARMIVTGGRMTQVRYATSVNSYLSSSDSRLHFGLGEETVATVEIHWPNGSKKVFRNVKADQMLKVGAADGPPHVTDRSR